jgi:hypothetical protein
MPKKMEKIRKAIKRENPKMPESSTYAIANDTYNKMKKKKAKKK